ncbi:phage tail protein, partial [Maricaulis maris]
MTAPRDDMPPGPSQLPVTTAPPAGQPGTALKRLRRGECPVTLSLHPFTADSVQTVTAPAGFTLADIVERHVPDPILRAHLVVELDGIEVDRGSWDVTRIEPGEFLLLRVRPAGDDGSKILRTILQVAVIAAATWVGGGAGGAIASAFWAAAAAATVQIVGSLIVNALVPPPQPNFGQGEAPSPTYSVDGARNQRLVYRPMPVLFGEHRVYPPLQGIPVQEIVGDDVYLRYLLNLGPMPLDCDVADIRIGETPITEYVGVEYEVRSKPTDPPITLYRDDPYTESVGSLLDGGAWVSRSTQTDTTEIVVVLAFPQGLGQVDDQGRNKSLSASFEMRYRPAGSSDLWVTARPTAPQGNAAASAGGSDRLDWFVGEGDLSNWTSNFPEGTASGAQTETRSEPGRPFRVALRAAVPKGQYDVEVRRTNAAQGDSKQKFDRLEWAALRSISSRDPMPLGDYAYMGVFIKASDQLSGVVDAINLVTKRRAHTLDAAIADADDPDLSEVSVDDWNGEAATRNVADNTLFLYRGGHTAVPLADSRIDWPAWAAFWRWCRDNGYTVDYVIDTPMTRAKAAQLLCAAGRARPIWINGKLSVVIDGPRADGERQLFTPRSTRGFRWRKAFPGTVHALRVAFTNREQGYREDEMLVFADGYSELGEAGGGPTGTLAASAYEKFELPGVTDPEVVWKLGRFWLYTALLQTETVEFDVDIESVASRAGDLAAVAHDVMLVGLGSARVAGLTLDESGDVTAITLDQAADASSGLLVMEAGKDYAIRWREVVETGPSSGNYKVTVTAALPVSTVAGPITALQLPDPVDPADAPKVGQLVAFGESGKETFPVLIKRIRPGRDFAARIEAVAYAPERFDADSGTVPAFDTRITLPRAPRPPTPTHTETHVTDDGIFVRFDVPEAYADNLSGFQVRWRQSPEDGSTARFERLPDLRSDERVAVLPPGVPGRTYDVEIITLGDDGRGSDPLLVTEIGASDAVSAPAGVNVTPATFTGPGGASIPGVSLQWTAAEDPRLVDLLVYAKVAGADADEYVVVDTEPPRAGQGDIRGLVPGREYDFGFAYRDQRGAVTQVWTEVAGITVPDALVATDTNAVGGEAAAAVLADVDAALDGLAQEVIDRIDGDEGLGVSLDEANARLDLARADIDHERRRLSSTLAQMLAGFTGLVSEVEFRADQTETAFVQIEGAVVRLGNAEAAIIAENTAWTDAVAAEAAARLLLTARMDVVEGEASDNADAVAAVAADLATEETTRASETGANAGDIVTLEGRMTNAEEDILVRATNDRVNEVEVDATEGLRAAARRLDSLTAQVLAGFAGYAAEREVRADETEAAFVEIEGAVVRLGNAEAAIIAENTAWTDAVAAEAAARLLLTARMDVVEGEASDNADAVAAVAADLATEETTRASETGANAGDIVTLEGRMTNAEGDILTRATNDRVNEVEVDATEGLRAASRGLDSLTAQVLAGFAGYAAELEVRAAETETAFVEIEGAVVRLGNAEAAIIAENTAWTDGVAVNAAAIVALDARQTTAEEDILARATIARVDEVELNAETALSESEDLIYAAIGDNASAVSVNAGALADVNNRLEATYGFTLDVGGKINGMQAHSDGETATVNFAFDFLVIEGEERFTFDTETGVLGAPGLAVDTVVAETVTARSIVNGQLGTRSAVYLDEFDFVSLASGTVNQESHFHTLTLTTEAIPVKPGSLLEVSIGYEISVESNSYEYFRFKDAISLLVTRSDDAVVEVTPTTWRDSFHIHTATTNTGSGPNVGNPYPIED